MVVRQLVFARQCPTPTKLHKHAVGDCFAREGFVLCNGPETQKGTRVLSDCDHLATTNFNSS